MRDKVTDSASGCWRALAAVYRRCAIRTAWSAALVALCMTCLHAEHARCGSIVSLFPGHPGIDCYNDAVADLAWDKDRWQGPQVESGDPSLEVELLDDATLTGVYLRRVRLNCCVPLIHLVVGGSAFGRCRVVAGDIHFVHGRVLSESLAFAKGVASWSVLRRSRGEQPILSNEATLAEVRRYVALWERPRMILEGAPDAATLGVAAPPGWSKRDWSQVRQSAVPPRVVELHGARLVVIFAYSPRRRAVLRFEVLMSDDGSVVGAETIMADEIGPGLPSE